MATMTTAELLDVFKNMTVLELNDFLKAFEEEFGVTAAAPVAVAAAPAAGGGGGEAAAAEEQDEFDVILTAAGDKKIQVIKEVRAIVVGPRPQGGQGPGRQRAQAGAGEGQQGRRREGEGAARRGRRHRRAQVERRAPARRCVLRAAPAPQEPVPLREGRGRVQRGHGEAVPARPGSPARRPASRGPGRAGGPAGPGGPGQPAQPAEDPGQRDLLRRGRRPDPLERLGVGLAVVRAPSTHTSCTVTSSRSVLNTMRAPPPSASNSR